MKITSPVQRRHSRIVIIPLIDIMFFLLASFMMISLQMDRTQNIQVHLPAATQAPHDFRPDMINIAVDKGGCICWARAFPRRIVDQRNCLLPQLPTMEMEIQEAI